MRFIYCFLIASLIVATLANLQTVKVKGRIICNNIAVRNVLVQLREQDTFDPDDTLAQQNTGIDGSFRLTGTEEEFTTIRPYIRVTHTCNVKAKGTCHRLTDVNIPSTFINDEEFLLDPLNLSAYEYTEICD